jgi:hypothetical protein
MNVLCRSFALLGATLTTGTVGHGRDNYGGSLFASSGAKTYPCNDLGFLRDQQSFENSNITADQAEDACDMVTAVLPAKKTHSCNHGYLYVLVASGVSIEIVSDLDQMDALKWPWLAVGNITYVQGTTTTTTTAARVIDWTHRGTSSCVAARRLLGRVWRPVPMKPRRWTVPLAPFLTAKSVSESMSAVACRCRPRRSVRRCTTG